MVKSFQQEELAQFLSGVLDAKQLLGGSVDDWRLIMAIAQNLFYPAKEFSDGKFEI